MLHPSSAKRAFTLIELLVVIAIIAILAAILFPVFARARENARRTSCLSNMKQIGLGLMQYTQDFDEHYPLSSWCNSSTCSDEDVPESDKPSGLFRVYAGGATNNHRTWMDFIYPYVKSTQIFVCPSSHFPRNTPNYGYSSAFSSAGSISYYLGVTTPYWIPISLSAVVRPSNVIVIAEHSTTESQVMAFSAERSYAVTAGHELKVAPHLDGGNMIFADGHAKWQSRQAIIAGIASTFSSTRCDLNSPDYTNNGYCSRDWNPYLN